MATIQINGISVELMDREAVTQTCNDMVTEAHNNLASGATKTKSKRQAEEKTLAFFGSLLHYVNGGADAK